MIFNFKKIISVGLPLSGLMFIATESQADCNITTSGDVSIGSISSIALNETGIQSNQFSAGLSCQAFATFATLNYIKYRVDLMPVNYKNSVTGESLTVNYLDAANNSISLGNEVNLGGFSLINLFSGPSGSLQFKAKVNSGQTVSPGTYRAQTPFKVKWYYSVPGLGIGPIAVYFQSPGVKLNLLGLLTDWGTGSDASFNLVIKVLPDCRISTNNINFGTAAFATEFEPVQTSMGIRCSAKTAYNVSLDDGLYLQNGFQRAMKSNSGNNYLRYEIYKNSTTERWGNWGSERWSSADATTNPGNYNGTVQQGYSFTAKVLDFNPDNLPAGNYKDTLTVKVEF
ncbi:Csu type fimbrial protein [Acinetobacter bereziniae]|uniref:Csu type fimbrial protein n=1 Tax=Acinetobacter bereziniae TaxID=106648 RepID=UPI00125016C2|nr:spore coat U domain-containing protein [Acinetobacter bereziniae]